MSQTFWLISAFFMQIRCLNVHVSKKMVQYNPPCPWFNWNEFFVNVGKISQARTSYVLMSLNRISDIHCMELKFAFIKQRLFAAMNQHNEIRFKSLVQFPDFLSFLLLAKPDHSWIVPDTLLSPPPPPQGS